MKEEDRRRLNQIGLPDEEIDRLLELKRKDAYARKQHRLLERRTKALPYFPFTLIEELHTTKLLIDSPEIDILMPLLDEYDLSGNGHCWAGILLKIIDNSPTLREVSIEVDSNSDS